jgi:hypothetical protein
VRGRDVAGSRAAWSCLGNGYHFDGASGLDAIARLLDRGVAEELLSAFVGAALGEVGELLFATLFGDPANWEPVFRALFEKHDGPAPRPTYDAVRLRVSTLDPVLLGLPWRATTWMGKRLVAGPLPWMFEATSEARAGRMVHLPRPARVLVIAPEVAGAADLGTAGHLRELREALRRVSRRYATSTIAACAAPKRPSTDARRATATIRSGERSCASTAGAHARPRSTTSPGSS